MKVSHSEAGAALLFFGALLFIGGLIGLNWQMILGGLAMVGVGILGVWMGNRQQ
jgi:hypothetical protein